MLPSYVPPYSFGSRNYDVILLTSDWLEKKVLSLAISHFFPFLALAQQKVEQKIHNRHAIDVLAVLFYSHAATVNGVWSLQ